MAHHEVNFEKYVVQKLNEQGWKVGQTANYDTNYALYPEDIITWLKNSGQEAKWQKLVNMNGDDAINVLMKRLDNSLEKLGTIQLLRRGFSIAGCGQLDMTETEPEDTRNEKALKRYEANILRVVPQLKYHPTREFAIDLVFFINGLAIATVELKTDFVQSVEAAIEQYRNDRLPQDPKTKRREPLLSFKRGAVVHFAMSDTEIYMTTKLAGLDTFFLPFNKGNNGHAGNAVRVDGDYPVAYFWQEVCEPRAWLRIFHNFIYVEKKDTVGLDGRIKKKETLIFPRYHQWDAVNKMIADAAKNGAGQSYLCEHSAGSGKTSTISWTAHDLIKLRDSDGKPKFNGVVIVTDRTVLDGQLQDAVGQIDHQRGLIATINRDIGSKSKSTQLAEALIAETPIIVVTIQTFPFAMEAILTNQKLKGNNYAVIIDEAHNSQTGATAAKLQAALAMSGEGNMAGLSVEELLERLQKSRAKPTNISYFAFTATPKHSTMMLFGRPTDPSRPASDDNLPQSFHRYPMRQAIEEGFIIDVLKGYAPYKTLFNLSKQIEDDRRVSGKAAKRALAQWMNLHPTNVTQKVNFIIEHFVKNVADLLDGKAKAMVVTSSRAAAVRYKKGFDDYIAKHPKYKGIQALVAFSGTITGQDITHSADELIAGDASTFIVELEAEFTEYNLNPGIGNQDLRHVFDRPEYRVMIVANKFQTGFDQPRLVAMYVDKKIANPVEIVQTFSRLNRTFPGKDKTFIIDFVNDPESVQAAFNLYDSGAQIEQAQDPNVVYEMKEQLDETGFYSEDELQRFKQARFQSAKDFIKAHKSQHKALFAATDAPTRRFNETLKVLRDSVQAWENEYQKAHDQGDVERADNADIKRRQYGDELRKLMIFKSGLGRLDRAYSYVAQLVDFGDPALENFAAFARLLQRRLDNEPKDQIDLKGLVLTGFNIDQIDNINTPVLEQGEKEYGPILKPIGPGGQIKGSDDIAYLKEIIERLNDVFGDLANLSDQVAFVNQTADIVRENSTVVAQIKNNPRSQALKGNLPSATEQAVFRAMGSHSTLAKQVLSKDKQAMIGLVNIIYDLISDEKSIDLDA